MPKTVAFGYEGDGHSPAEVAQGLRYLNYWANGDYMPGDLPEVTTAMRMPDPDLFLRNPGSAAQSSGSVVMRNMVDGISPIPQVYRGPETYLG
jgi:hypothetical protein